MSLPWVCCWRAGHSSGRRGEMPSSSLRTETIYLCPHPRSEGTGVGVLDSAAALDLLGACVRRFGPEHRPSPDHPRRAGGIVPTAIRQSGLPASSMRRIEYSTRHAQYYGLDEASALTLGAHVTLSAAAGVERRGGTWGESLIAASRMASRFINLIQPAD